MSVQSNLDGKFYGYDSFGSTGSVILSPGEGEDYTEVKVDGNYWMDDLLYTPEECGTPAVWTMDVTEPIMIKGTVEVNLRIKVKDIDVPQPYIRAYLVDSCDESFSAYSSPDYITDIESEVVDVITWESGGQQQQTQIIEWIPIETNFKSVTDSAMSLTHPNSRYESYTATAPETPVASGEWNDYHLYLDPMIYTVQPGHRLSVYVVPTGRMVLDEEDQEEWFHGDNAFTIDNRNSYAVIPTV